MKKGKKLLIATASVVIVLIITLTIATSATGIPSATTEDETQPVTLTIKENKEEAEILAKLIWGEARGVRSDAEKAAVAWCALNRVDDEDFPDTIEEVVEAPYQFIGYDAENPVEPELRNIASDVLRRWQLEKTQGSVPGRTLPKEYKYFWGDGKHNHFTIEWLGDSEWDWSLPSPYSVE